MQVTAENLEETTNVARHKKSILRSKAWLDGIALELRMLNVFEDMLIIINHGSDSDVATAINTMRAMTQRLATRQAQENVDQLANNFDTHICYMHDACVAQCGHSLEQTLKVLSND